jgi:hypothetical protein
MTKRNLLLSGGVLAVALATVGYIALNADTSRYLSTSELSDSIQFLTNLPSPSPVSPQSSTSDLPSVLP